MDILTPLVYCQVKDQNGDECDTFSSVVVEGLLCCQRCGERLMKALDDEGVVLVKRVLDKKK